MKLLIFKSCRCVVLLSALVITGGAQAAFTNDLPTLVADVLASDPAILEAKANEELAATQTEATRAQRLPTLGVSAAEALVDRDERDTPFRGVVGRINLYSSGMIGAQIERDEFRQAQQHFKTEETREYIAYTMTSDYLEALRATELLNAERANLGRHQRIVSDLEIVVNHDGGRRHELVQARSRALQVELRMVQYQKAIGVALSRLTRFTDREPSLQDPVPESWREILPASVLTLPHPSVQAQKQEAASLGAEQRSLERSLRPRVDLEAGAGNDEYAQVQLRWDFFDRPARFNSAAAGKQLAAARLRADQIERTVNQQAATAETEIEQSLRQIRASSEQIRSSAEVAELYQLQFKVGRRSLLDLVNAYAELASVEIARINAVNDHRQAVVNLLYARAALADWLLAQR